MSSDHPPSREIYRRARMQELRRIEQEQIENLEFAKALEKKVDNLAFKTNLMWAVLGALAGVILTGAGTVLVTWIIKNL